jgi:two-component system phosphate regulon response regulator PhoB
MTLILVVDDDPDISRLVEFKLSHAGMDVVTKTDGESGLAAAEQLLPELVLLDWIMPKLTGIEVCQRLRANSRTAGIPVVLLTAKAQQPRSSEARLAARTTTSSNPSARASC